MNGWKEVFQRPHDLRLYVIHTGNVHMKGNIHFHKKSPAFNTKPKDPRYNPVYSFLIVHPQRGLILIDTGIHPDFNTQATGNFGCLIGTLIKVKTDNGMDVISQIKSIGLNAKNIKHIVMTHLHPDHTSGLPQFKNNAECLVYIDIDEYHAARSYFGLFRGYLTKHLKGLTIQHFEYPLTHKPLEQAADLFGDESVFIIKTSGHTTGHISILLNLKGEPVLLTADAAHRHENLAEQIPTVGEYGSSLRTLKQLGEFVEAYPSTRVIYSHDPEQIKQLKLIPEYYE